MKKTNLLGKKVILILYSCIISSLIIFNNNFHFSGNVFDGMRYNYVSEISLSQILMVIPLTFLVTCLFYGVVLFYKKYDMIFLDIDLNRNRQKRTVRYILMVVGLFICWLPYLLSNIPGAVYSDGFNSIQQVLSGVYSNHHPLVYTWLVGVFIHIGLAFGNLDYGIICYTIFQMIIMASVLSWSILWMADKHVKKTYMIVTFLLFAFCPLFPYYAIALWKDTIFSLLLFMFCLLQIDIYLSDAYILSSKKGIIHYSLLALGIVFFRNNGIYIILFSLFFLFILYKKNIRQYLRKFAFSTVVIMSVAIFIQGPLFEKLDLSTEFVENLGIPMQQISAVVACNGNISSDEEKFLSEIWDLDELAAMYTPCLADTPKGYVTSFNSVFLENHKKEFIQIWIQIFFKNPKIYIKAFLMENLGFWHLTTSGNVAYVQSGVWPNDLGVEAKDIFNDLFGFSFSDIVYPRHYISCGLLFWICILSMVICIYNNSVKAIIMFTPIIGAWITMMIATPVAISLRYMYILILVIPFILLWPVLDRKNRIHYKIINNNDIY